MDRIQFRPRKAIKHSRGSTLISLPCEWVQANRIQPGEDLTVELYEDGGLLIKPRGGAT